MHVKHSAVADSHARHGCVLSCSSCHSAHEHRAAGMVQRLVWHHDALACLPLVCHWSDDAGRGSAVFSDASLVPHAPAHASEGHRLARSCLLESARIADCLHLQLWRLARLVALLSRATAFCHLAHHACWMSSPHVDKETTLFRTSHVDLPPSCSHTPHHGRG